MIAARLSHMFQSGSRIVAFEVQTLAFTRHSWRRVLG